MELTQQEYELIIQSLRYTRQAFENYMYYPSYEFKQSRIKEVDIIIEKIRREYERSK